MKELWVPAIQIQLGGAPCFHPDIPDGLNSAASTPLVTHWEYGADGAGWPADKLNSGMLSTHFCILVDEKEAEHCKKAIPESAVPEKEVLMVRMIQNCQGDYDRKADAYFDSIPNMTTATAARKRMVKDILLQARARGLSAEKAEEIRLRHKLPVSKMVEV